MEESINTEDYGIGFNDKQGTVMVVTIPLMKWAKDKHYGDVLVSGVFVKAERIALKNLAFMRTELEKSGVLKTPPGMSVQ